KAFVIWVRQGPPGHRPAGLVWIFGCGSIMYPPWSGTDGNGVSRPLADTEVHFRWNVILHFTFATCLMESRFLEAISLIAAVALFH
ncbi:hypothetical protein, partial [Glutamicibacter creatinolyticus]|uniref:hypothetical protein n=1 Tax=Glutamicibacter creatinolyticus TaxID=162496 RepID=UPI0032173747